MSRKRRNAPDDMEPTLKLTSDGDLLLKNLLDKQLSKETDLRKELGHKKEFVSSAEYVPISNFICGVTSLNKFKDTSNCQKELDQLKTAGLSHDDINFYVDSKKGLEYLTMKHKNLDLQYVNQRLEHIHSLLEIHHLRNNEIADLLDSKTRRHKTEFMLSVKPNSMETNLLKFALDNEKKTNDHAPSAIDNIKDLEKDMMNSVCGQALNPSKIQKRARRMKTRIDSMKPEIEEPKCNIPASESFVKNSKWDIKIPESQDEVRKNTGKVYGCAAETSSNLYTIKDGKIIKINNLEISGSVEYKKLTIDEIRLLPKFAQYDPGIPSKILYVKNLSSQSRSDIETLFESFNFHIESLKMLKGRMRGQAFIEMDNSVIAEKALASMNGTIINNKPIIIEFGRKSN